MQAFDLSYVLAGFLELWDTGLDLHDLGVNASRSHTGREAEHDVTGGHKRSGPKRLAISYLTQ